jgi:hypothetical protein
VNGAACMPQALVWIEGRWSDQLPAKSGGIVPASADCFRSARDKGRSMQWAADPGLRKSWETPENEPGYLRLR